MVRRESARASSGLAVLAAFAVAVGCIAAALHATAETAPSPAHLERDARCGVSEAGALLAQSGS